MGAFRFQSLVSNAKQLIKLNSKHQRDVPKGYLAVYVGEDQRKRFVVPLSYLDQPLFQELLRRSEEDFGTRNNHLLQRMSQEINIHGDVYSGDVKGKIRHDMVKTDVALGAEHWSTLHLAQKEWGGRTDFVPAYVRLLRDNEAEVRIAAAGKVTKFSRILGLELAIQHILPCVKELSSYLSQHVRSALASVILGMDPVLGKDASIEQLLPIFLSLMNDEFPEMYKELCWDLEQLIGSGGMPPSHSATVTAFAVAFGLHDGLGSSTFATALILACIAMYDATSEGFMLGAKRVCIFLYLCTSFGKFVVIYDAQHDYMIFSFPQSFTSLSSVSDMYLQNNQFTCTIDVLANLPLKNLNVANNKFTGWIPNRLNNINLQKDGNSWNSGLAPPSPSGTPAALGGGSQNSQPRGNNSSSTGDSSNSGKKIWCRWWSYRYPFWHYLNLIDITQTSFLTDLQDASL
ncbi:serine/threonine-protein phosphatase 2A 65 kDa regulatory subunit A beta isoform-like protein [Tanacetum coccineum]